MAGFLDLREGIRSPDVTGNFQQGQLNQLEVARQGMANQESQMRLGGLARTLEQDTQLKDLSIEERTQQIQEAVKNTSREGQARVFGAVSAMGKAGLNRLKSGDITINDWKNSAIQLGSNVLPEESQDLFTKMIQNTDDADDVEFLVNSLSGTSGAKLTPQEEADLRVETAGRIEKLKQGTTSARQTTEERLATSKALSTALGKKEGERLSGRKDEAIAAVDALANSDATLALLDDGIITGTAANFRLGLGRLLKTAGVWDDTKDLVANTEAFTGSMAKETAEIIKAFGAGTGLSDADREYALKAAGGDINMTESGIRRLMEINRKSRVRKITSYLDDVDNTVEGDDNRSLMKINLSPELRKEIAEQRSMDKSGDSVAFTYHPLVKRDILTSELEEIAKAEKTTVAKVKERFQKMADDALVKEMDAQRAGEP